METIRTLFEKATARTPRKTFFIFNDCEIVYEDFLATSSSNLKPLEIEEGDLAVILYASRTTGAPKGRMATHAYFVNLAHMEASR